MPPDHPPACRVGEILPNADLAIVSPRKLRDYALNRDPTAKHDGRHKARVFAAVLDIHQHDWPYLRDWLLLGGMQAPVTTGWVVEDEIPRLAPAFIRKP